MAVHTPHGGVGVLDSGDGRRGASGGGGGAKGAKGGASARRWGRIRVWDGSGLCERIYIWALDILLLARKFTCTI